MIEIVVEDSVGGSDVRVVLQFPLFPLSMEDEQRLVEAVVALGHSEVTSQEDAFQVSVKPIMEKIARYFAAVHSVGPRTFAIGMELMFEKLNQLSDDMSSIITIGDDLKGRPPG